MRKFIGFGLSKWSDKINHLSYADDTILFCSANKKSMKLMIEVLKEYEKVSGQLINYARAISICMRKHLMHWKKNEEVDRHRTGSLSIHIFRLSYLLWQKEEGSL